ncbi:hypothetical protein LPJ61_000882 [Coemansia biformis]|uniref:Cullin family profile domain-containing protein n=1 Tax=Coemansia biformis TaxID=1286918 RepID=A0A9W8D0M6_9FUNG|nr:hypothetical protein LPJ61_000882 [Coemansia biformis]
MSFASKRPGGRILPVTRLTPQVNPQEQFAKLAAAIEEIYNHNASKLLFEELYRIGYGLVLSKNGALAYDGVKGVLEAHLRRCVRQDILGHADAAQAAPTPTSSDALLSSVRVLWSEHVTAMLIIKDILMYVDRVYVENAHVLPVYEMGMCVFRDQVLLAPQRRLSADVAKAVLGQIAAERRGAEVGRGVLRGVVDMLVELQDTSQLGTVYEAALEPQLLLETRTHYEGVAGARLTDHGAAAYARAAQDDIDAEMGRADAYLTPSTGASLRRVLLDELISKRANEILTTPGAGLVQLLDQRDAGALRVLFGLYSPLPAALEVLHSGIHSHILELGKLSAESLAPLSVGPNPEGAGCTEAAQPVPPVLSVAAKTAVALRWVQDVLALYDVYDGLLREAFGESQDMRKAIHDAFIQIINANSRAAELLSLFIDESLRSGLKRKGEQEAEHLLERSVLMFRFLQNKDAFEHYYKSHLAKRLLFGRSLSDDAEQSLVSKLKVECGSQFTLKLEGMFKDMQLSADLAQGFKDAGVASELGFEMNVSVLTPTFWPALAPPMPDETKRDMRSVRPPAGPLRHAVELFSDTYLERHSGRRLEWQYNMGSADIKVQFGGRTHELNVSTYQMFILMLFADTEEDAPLTAAAIQERTRIPWEVLVRQLQSLACAKYKILAKAPASRTISPTDTFVFNSEFTSPQYRVRIPAVAARSSVEGEKEKAASLASIGKERQYLIEAALVRIMKARKQVMHEQLVSEAVSQLAGRFLPTPKMVKDAVGRLIDREYLQRSPDDPRLYVYLA